jgi:hypothetical protein
MPVLYYKEDYAMLEIDRDGDYVLRVVGVGPEVRDFEIVLDDEELDRYRDWGEHFVVTLAHRVHRNPARYMPRNRLAPRTGATAPEEPPALPAGVRRGIPPWAAWAAGAAGVLLVWLLLLYFATSRPEGEGKLVSGTAVGLHSTPDDVGDLYYLTVRLEGGDTVQVRVSGRADYRENAALLVRAAGSSILGGRSWRFERYR